jgi:hypothetical protein
MLSRYLHTLGMIHKTKVIAYSRSRYTLRYQGMLDILIPNGIHIEIMHTLHTQIGTMTTCLTWNVRFYSYLVSLFPKYHDTPRYHLDLDTSICMPVNIELPPHLRSDYIATYREDDDTLRYQGMSNIIIPNDIHTEITHTQHTQIGSSDIPRDIIILQRHSLAI